MRRRRPEGQSEEHGRDIGRERWSVWSKNSGSVSGGGGGGGEGVFLVLSFTLLVLTRKWLLLPQEFTIYCFY